MDDKKKLFIDDLPTIEELQNRFRTREIRLSQRFKGDASKIMIARNTEAYQFLFENFLMLELKDKELVNRTAKRVAQLGFFSLVVPTVLNIGLARMTYNRIFDLHWTLRASLRLAIFVYPIYLTVDYGFASYTRVSMYLTDKYLERIEKFRKIPDPKIINPNIETEEV